MPDEADLCYCGKHYAYQPHEQFEPMLKKPDTVRLFKSATNVAQPAPEYQKGEPFVWDLVLQDMMERDRIGYERYKTRLQPHNGRVSLIDAYQEALDLVVYLRQAIYESTGR